MRTSLALIALATLPLMPNEALAATQDVTFELRPHCEETEHAAAETTFGGEVPQIDGIMNLTQESTVPCPPFAVRDPLSRQTPELSMGDTLDMDLIIHNPSNKPLTRIRAFINYDATILDGIELTLSDAFPVAPPGETDFVTAENTIKIGGVSEEPIRDSLIVIARIRMTVLSTPTLGTILSFANVDTDTTSRTGAFTGDGNTEANEAAPAQGSLAVRIRADAATTSTQSSISSAQTSSTVSAVSSSSTPAASVLFREFQVQNLRVTTDGSSAYLAWTPLPSTDLDGYNLYYGTVSGRYLQRRSVDAVSQTTTIRALPVGTTYYFAIRAVKTGGEESDYSQEVAVTIGNPATSTSPLSGAVVGGPQGNTPGTGGMVAGESGPTSWLLGIILLSAAMGTFLAVRRQWTATLPQ